jgi:hypothetical protein
MTNFYSAVTDKDGNLIIDPVIVYASATTDSNGAFTVDMTNAAYTHVYSVSATVISADTTVANSAFSAVSTFNLTTVTGKGVRSQTVGALGGSPVQSVGSGHTVYITVIGDQN